MTEPTIATFKVDLEDGDEVVSMHFTVTPNPEPLPPTPSDPEGSEA